MVSSPVLNCGVDKVYLEFFKLTEKPFSLTPDTQLFLNQNCHKEALNTLMLALQEGEGFLKVVGEVGTGKTILCRTVLRRMHEQNYVSAYIPNPWLSPEELKQFLAAEIGAEHSNRMQSHEITSSIYRRLVQIARSNKKAVLLIDEAQSMPIETIESLRLLTNLESEKRKLLQVVIFGQPELDVLLARKDLRQLQQRIVFSETLVPLSESAVNDYIQFRIVGCGGSRQLFNSGAVFLLAKASGGIPRLINVMAHKALMCAFGKGDQVVTPWHVARAISDTQEARMIGRVLSVLWRLSGHKNTSKVVSCAE